MITHTLDLDVVPGRQNYSAPATTRRKSIRLAMPSLACVKSGRSSLRTLRQGKDCGTR